MRRSTNRDGWYRGGPLGLDNYRKQLGRSFELGDPLERTKCILLYCGATQNLAGDDTRRAAGDAAASLISVSCTYRSHNEANADRPLTVRGTIEWGTDGHQCVAQYDWLNGTVIQVSASFIKVVAQIVDTQALGDEAPTHDPDAICTVGATIGYWGAARLAPTLTQQVALAGEAAPAPLPTAVLAIPRFARRLWWLGPVPTSALWALGPNPGQEIANIDPAGLTVRQPYERPGPATHVHLTGVAAVTLNTLTWELVI